MQDDDEDITPVEDEGEDENLDLEQDAEVDGDEPEPLSLDEDESDDEDLGVGEEYADFVPAERPPPGHRAGGRPRPRDRRRTSVGIRIVGDRDIGVAGLGQRHQQVHGARLFRVGEGHGRERRVRLRLGRHHRRFGEPGRLERGQRDLATDAVQWRVRERKRPGAIALRCHRPRPWCSP